jgi:transposase-like protein/IS1 family transposase
MEKTKITRPPLASLACVVETCDLYRQVGQNNLTIRKVYGRDQIRYLRCRACGQEFSERKNTALWNSKIAEARAVSIAEHLSEGCSLKSTARLVKADVSTIKRLNRRLGEHGQTFHEQQVSDVAVKALQADERYGFAVSKQQPQWEAEVIDPESKFVLAHVQGRRNETLIRSLLSDTHQQLAVESVQDFVLFTDGEPAYTSLFPSCLAHLIDPHGKGHKGGCPT